MKNRILERKMLFLHHVAALPPGSLAREVYETQRRENLPGLVKECQPIFEELGTSNIESFNKYQFV